MEWHLPNDKPTNFASIGLTDIIFCDSIAYHIGKTGPDGKWYAYQHDKVLDAIDAWAFLPDGPGEGPLAVTGQEWIAGNGPVSSSFSHFLLYDHQEMIYRNIDSNYFDSQNRTFEDISHHIVLPNLPLRLAGPPMINKHKSDFLTLLKQQPALKDLTLEPYNDRCLYIAIKELLNTTVNGLRRYYALEGDALRREAISRWAFQVNNGLNMAENKTFIPQSFGTVKAPDDQTERDAIRQTLDKVVKAFKD